MCYKDGPSPRPMAASDTVYVMGHGMRGVGALANASWDISKRPDQQVPGAALVSAHETRQQMDRLGLTQGVGKIKLFSCQSAERDGPRAASLLEHFRATGPFEGGTPELTGYKGSLRLGHYMKISKVRDGLDGEVKASTQAVHIPARPHELQVQQARPAPLLKRQSTQEF